MEKMLEIRGFMWLSEVFRERSWSNPYQFSLQTEVTGLELLAMLDISADKVEGIFVNGHASPAALSIINPGDRVALVPPGMPGPHRVLLGIRRKD